MKGRKPPKRERFVDEYLVDLNITQAAIRCGYSRASAGQQGNRLFRNVQIRAEIDRRMAERAQKTGVTAERVVQELARMGLADVRDVAEWDASGVRFKASADLTENAARAIQSVKSRERTTYDADGNPTTTVELELKLYPKDPALNLLARHLGMLKDPAADALTNVAEAIRAARERASKR